MTTDTLLLGGLMSGTSLDGVDAVLMEVVGSDPLQLRWRVRGFRTEAYSSEERDRLRRVISSGGAKEIALLHRDLGLRFADTLLRLMDQEGVAGSDLAAVGSHGQTIWHEPPGPQRAGATLQIADPATLAEAVGCPVVSDFRSRDVAAGGQGAPLVPWCDWVLFRREGRGRALQNIGGMANVTLLPSSGGPERVIGFDTGPGVALLDGAVSRATSGAERWDVGGERARRGRVMEEPLSEWMDDAFFHQPPPRSTGRERYGDARLEAIVAEIGPSSERDWDDLIATLTALTVRSVALAYDRFLPEGAVDEVVVTGGGARNPVLMEGLAEALGPTPVLAGADALGMNPDAREAAAFALLAWAHLNGVPGNVPGVTGASGSRVLGSLTPGAAPA